MTSSQSRRERRFPVLGVLAGILFILAGLAAFFHLETGFSLALIFIIAGSAVVLVGIAGFRTGGWDIVLFIIGLIVLAGVVETNYYQISGNVVYSYSASREQVNASRIDVLATTSLGSIDVRFSGNADLAYQVTFGTAVFGFPFFNPTPGDFQLTNQTRDGILFLNSTSSTSSITITLGMSYAVRINATASTGSISLSRPSGGEAKIQSVSLTTSTGSVNAQVEGSSISGIVLKTTTGSVNLESNYLSPSSMNVPISISSSTGSANVNMKIANNVAVWINASTSLGSISHNLPGFGISEISNNRLVASVGNINSAGKSFIVTIDAGIGSISINADLVSPR